MMKLYNSRGRFNIFAFRFIIGVIVLVIASWFLFNYLLGLQNKVMYEYFIAKPSEYNLERAGKIATSIYRSFYKEVPDPTKESLRAFLSKYNEIPFLKVNFILVDKKTGVTEPIIGDIRNIDLLNVEYTYSVRDSNKDLIGHLLIYDINKEYDRGLVEYKHMMNFTRIFFVILILLLLSILVIQEYTYKIKQAKKIAEYDARHDGLTGLYTQKYFKNVLEDEMYRARRYKRPLSLIIADLDYFKDFNDKYGHLIGDRILKKVARVISFNVRKVDIVARYGGEEFVIIMPETGIDGIPEVHKKEEGTIENTIKIADRIRAGVKRTKIVYMEEKVGVTISVGIACYDGLSDCTSKELINKADKALYESKRAGRNKVTIYNADS